MRYFLLAVVLYMTVPLLASAQYLNKIYDYNNSGDWGYSVFVQQDGNYFVIGGGKRQFFELMAKRISPNGLELLNRTILSSTVHGYFEGNPGAIKRTQDKNGYIVPYTTSRPYFQTYFDFAGLAKLDNNGDTVWVKLHTDTFQMSREFGNDCNLMPDGGYLLAIRRDGILGSSVLNRTDSLGNIIWSVTHPSNGFYTCEYIGDGRILAGGFKTRLKYYGQYYYYLSQPWFTLYDTSGNLLKDTLYDLRYSGGGRIYKDKNGGFFHWGAFDSLLYPGAPDNGVNFPEYMAHLDDSFRVVWLKNFANMLNKRSIWNVRQLRDSNYLLVGNEFKRGWAAKLDKNGNTMWENRYFFDDSTSYILHWLVDAAERPDGSIVMTGSVGGNGVSHGQDVWVVVVDSMGCIIPNCAPTPVQEVKKELEVVVFPNPTSGRFTIHTSEEAELTIQNLQGIIIGSFAIKSGNNDLELPQYISQGIYLVNIVDKAGTTTIMKLIYNR